MVALISFSALFGSCQKEQQELTQLNLIAEGFKDNGAKLAVDGLTSSWVDGEQVRINDNGPLTISYTSGSNATVAGTFTTPIRAIYPAGISSSDLTAGTTTVTLPAEYQYAATGGLQSLQSPMAAYSASGDEVHFKHLTGALTVKVTNSLDKSIRLSSITVTSSKYQLSGEWNVDFTALEGTGTPVETATAADRSVTMRFDGGSFSIAASGEKSVQIPVPPVGDDHSFTVTVTYNTSDATALTTKQNYTLTKSQTGGTGHALARAELGYVPLTAASSGAGITTDWLPKDASGYYLISQPFHLRVVSANSSTATEFDNARYKLRSDLYTSTVTDFVTIDKCQIFNGQGHTIYDLKIHNDGSYCGMFKAKDYVLSVSNLTLSEPSLIISSAVTYIGTLVSTCEVMSVEPDKISNCTVTSPTVVVGADLSGVTRRMGGLIGYQSGSTSVDISNTAVTGFKVQTVSAGTIVSLDFGGMVGFFANTGTARLLTMTGCSFSTTNPLTVTGELVFGGLLGRMESAGSSKVRPTNCSVDVTATLTINQTGPTSYDFNVGAFVGKDGASAATIVMGGTGTTYTGNTTSGTITTTYAATTGNKYIGAAANKYVCGQTKVMPPTNQDVDDLKLTIN